MKKAGIVFLAIAGMLTFGTLAYATDTRTGDPNASSEPQSMAKDRRVVGELTKIEGDMYVLKDPAGQETRVHVNRSTTKLDRNRTRMERDFQVGDKVEALVTPEGHASLLQIAMAAPPMGGKDADLGQKNDRQ